MRAVQLGEPLKAGKSVPPRFLVNFGKEDSSAERAALSTRMARGATGPELNRRTPVQDERDTSDFAEQVEAFRSTYQKIIREIRKVIAGHEGVIHEVMACLLSGGHALLEGIPGLGKTLLVRTLAKVLPSIPAGIDI